jgi:hypothetical protein
MKSVCEISGSRGGNYEDDCLQGCCTLQCGRSLPMRQEVLAASIIRAMMMEAVNTFEMSVNFYQTTWCNIPEDSHLDEHCPQLIVLWCKREEG